MTSDPIRIIMVCLGNICRSPMAQGVMEETLSQHGIEAFVDSAGTAAYHSGEAPDLRGQSEMRRNGIDISNQRARQFNVADFDSFDYIFAMDKSNYQNIIELAQSHDDKQKVSMIMHEVDSSTDIDVPDPYYGGDAGFNKVYHMLVEASEAFARRI